MTPREIYDWRLVAAQMAAMSTKLVRACDVLEAAAKAEQLLDQVRRLSAPASVTAVIEFLPASPGPQAIATAIPQVTRTVRTSELTNVSGRSDGGLPSPVSAAAERRPAGRAVDQARPLAARAVGASADADSNHVAGSRSAGRVPF